MNELRKDSVESSEMVEQTFKFWFNDNEHIRSPFPAYIHSQLKTEATDLFFNWASGIDPKAKEELNDEIIGEKFEEFIFETATKLIKTEDERITILYPFLPRLGDKLKKEEKLDSEIVDRSILKEGDTSYLKLKLENIETKEKWEEKIELPL
ncbi:MAG: hypothetical protein COA33_012355 [Fluviicola sp.]|nr:hypothetical protein [Fluviicola sp.]